MTSIVTSDIHFGHKLVAITRGFFDGIDCVKEFRYKNKNNPELGRLGVNFVKDRIKDGTIAQYIVDECINNMDEEIIEKFNYVVGDTDTVHFVGDMYFGNDSDGLVTKLDRMKGKNFILIKGNHDSSKITRLSWAGVYDRYTLNENNCTFYLDHYPLATWNKAHYGSYNLHGHCHGSYPISSQQMDVGVDTNDLYPYTIQQCIDKMSKAKKFIIPDYHGSVG